MRKPGFNGPEKPNGNPVVPAKAGKGLDASVPDVDLATSMVPPAPPLDHPSGRVKGVKNYEKPLKEVVNEEVAQTFVGKEMVVFQPCFEILPPAQRALWPSLGGIAKMGFVLYGGTAIALRFGHRESVDFDFFTDRPFDHQELVRAIPAFDHALVLQEEPNTLTLSIESKQPDEPPVKVSFFTVGTGRIWEPEWTSDGVILAASMKDLMAHKLKVVLQRVEKKDYLDVHALITHGFDLADGLASARAMFGRSFQPAEALKALTYFKGGDLHDLTPDIQKELIRAVAKVEDLPAIPVVLKRLDGGSE